MKIKIEITPCRIVESNDLGDEYMGFNRIVEYEGLGTEVEIEDNEIFNIICTEIKDLCPNSYEDPDYIPIALMDNYTTCIAFKIFDISKDKYDIFYDEVILTGGYFKDYIEPINKILNQYICQHSK